jgi:hypothetical protein
MEMAAQTDLILRSLGHEDDAPMVVSSMLPTPALVNVDAAAGAGPGASASQGRTEMDVDRWTTGKMDADMGVLELARRSTAYTTGGAADEWAVGGPDGVADEWAEQQVRRVCACRRLRVRTNSDRSPPLCSWPRSTSPRRRSG